MSSCVSRNKLQPEESCYQTNYTHLIWTRCLKQLDLKWMVRSNQVGQGNLYKGGTGGYHMFNYQETVARFLKVQKWIFFSEIQLIFKWVDDGSRGRSRSPFRTGDTLYDNSSPLAIICPWLNNIVGKISHFVLNRSFEDTKILIQ
jgi:hypothetical protein